ncbi:hypothetical protein TL16_g11259 [Triparma laevis f. inornata]|uniref:(S)-ureidoglycine aminohydrolase cupin domain-containing protein n=1 Tax=Triparma laevis f. inornata TaxID=1714386 RepID=A0A9W7ESZ4_9STRA|nr:hypothetical protein TL16_g11259 [Triparma laevis f. inornata]
MSLFVVKSANVLCESDLLDDLGKRAGSGEGECQMRGRCISKTNGVNTGIWECSPGSFDVLNRTNCESVIILSGKVKLTDLLVEGGGAAATKELEAGDVAVLEKGSSVRWEIVETVRKMYVIAPEKMSEA